MKKTLMILTVIAAVCMLAGPVMSEVKSGGVTATFVGLSSDTKPEITQVGATFKESDTGSRYYLNESSAWVLDAIEVVTTDTLTTSGETVTVATGGFDEVTLFVDAGGSTPDCYVEFEGKAGTSGWGNLDSSADSTNVTTSTVIQSYKEAASCDSLRVRGSTISAGNSLYINIKRVNRFKR